MKKFLALAACMVLLSGCTQSNIVKPTAETKVADPDFEVQEGIAIDWAQVSVDAEELFANESEYPYSRDFHFYLEPTKKEVMLIWVVADDFPDGEILEYAEDLIKGFNDTVAVQDFSISHSSVDSYGGLWQQYGLSFSIVPESTQDDEDTWFISASYSAGTEFVLPDKASLTAAQENQGESAEQTAEPEAEGNTETAP